MLGVEQSAPAQANVVLHGLYAMKRPLLAASTAAVRVPRVAGGGGGDTALTVHVETRVGPLEGATRLVSGFKI